MESLSQALQPHKDLIGGVASVVTIGQFFSGAFICKDIYKQQSTRNVNAVPFIGGITIGTLMLQYAIMLEDLAMYRVNLAAIVLNVVYIGVYYLYCSEKWHQIYKPSALGALLVAVLLGYIGYEDPELIESRYGLIVTILMLLLIGSPLLELSVIVEKQDASNIPFPMTFMGAVVSFLWLLYGIILLNYFMVVQNLIGFGLCLVQLFLLYKYPGKPAGQQQKKKKQTKRD